MCGIVGMYEYRSGGMVDPGRLRSMADALVHRGPDDEGFFTSASVGLGARRLSIVDIAHGHQPQHGCTDRVHIAFNGEIYNYRELRSSLASTHQFASESDTEVVLHLYEDHGTAAIARLDGMFALAIHDDAAGSLLLARDRLGKKPLYYADLGNALIFASEIKSLLIDPRVSRELDLEALHHYLSLLVVPAPFSIFKAIRKLPAGHLLECSADGVRIRQYWTDPAEREPVTISREDAAAAVRELLTRAVEKRLIGDVPVGAFLSGGLDSCSVVALLSRLRARPRTYSMGFTGRRSFDELPAAREVAAHFGTDHHEIVASPDIVKLIPEVVHYADEPFAISSAIPTLLLSRAAARDLKVVLTGDGGDEVFGGYPRHLYEQWASWYRRVPSAIDPLVGAGARAVGAGRLARTFLDGARLGVGPRRLAWSAGWDEASRRELYAPDVRERIADVSSARLLEQAVASVRDPVEQHVALDRRIWLPDEMLCKVDRMTMAASLEARSPLLDIPLLEYVATLPRRMRLPRYGRRELKKLLREAVAPLVPARLLSRPKHGFDVPLDDWMREDAAPILHDVLSPERIKRRGLFDPGYIDRVKKDHAAGRTRAGNRLYALLVFELWAEEYLR